MPLFGGTREFDKYMQPILNEYLKIHSSLAKDSTEGVLESARKIEKHTAKLNSKSVTGEHAGHYKNVPVNVKKAAKKMSAAKTKEEMRSALKELSKPMAMWAGMSKPKGVKVAYCSMVRASWLQEGKIVLNPYDMKMPHCGEFVGGDLGKKKHEEKDHKKHGHKKDEDGDFGKTGHSCH